VIRIAFERNVPVLSEQNQLFFPDNDNDSASPGSTDVFPTTLPPPTSLEIRDSANLDSNKFVMESIPTETVSATDLIPRKREYITNSKDTISDSMQTATPITSMQSYLLNFSGKNSLSSSSLTRLNFPDPWTKNSKAICKMLNRFDKFSFEFIIEPKITARKPLPQPPFIHDCFVQVNPESESPIDILVHEGNTIIGKFQLTVAHNQK